jgi:hypothetical protein
MGNNYFNYLPQYQLAAAGQYLYDHKDGTTVDEFNNYMTEFAGERSLANDLLDVLKEFNHIAVEGNIIKVNESFIDYFNKKYVKK